MEKLVDIEGTPGPDILTGTSDPDRIDGQEGDDVLTGLAGDDVLIGGSGNDTMAGGADNDVIYVDALGDIVIELAGEGYDRVAAASSYTLGGGVEVELLEAITLTATDPFALRGNEFANRLIGNAGANQLWGGAGVDVLHGLGGNDTFLGEDGLDLMYGGPGNDTFFITPGDRVFDAAGEGTDRVVTAVSYALPAGAEIETLEPLVINTDAINLYGNEFANRLVGTLGANILDGGAGNDRLEAGEGNDVLIGGPGADVMFGSAGDDTFYVDNALDVVSDYFTGGDGGANDRVATSVDYKLTVDAAVEVLEALHSYGTEPLRLIGNRYDTHIIGNEGDNWLQPGIGTDILEGHGGSDSFVIQIHDGVDGTHLTIQDFEVGVDTVVIGRHVFHRLELGALPADEFSNDGMPHDDDDRVVYDPATGNLYYYDYGRGSTSHHLMAHFVGAPALTAADIIVADVPFA